MRTKSGGQNVGSEGTIPSPRRGKSGSGASGRRVMGNSKGTGAESVGLCPETRESQGKRMARVSGAKRVRNGCEPGIFSQVTGNDRYVTK